MEQLKTLRKGSLVAGGAGFIGSNLIRKLLNEGRQVVVVDNFSRGSSNNIPLDIRNSKYLELIEADLSKESAVMDVFEKTKRHSIDEVWHLAANSDIPAGVQDSSVDLKDTFMTTYSLLRGMKAFNVTNFHFASSSAIYGDLGDEVLHENIGPLLPISNYGAMKLASEALISAAAESFLSRVNIFRFPNVVGVPATHGVIFDFVNKLILNPAELNVLGDGTQQKSYLHVVDLIDAMLTIRSRDRIGKIDFVNIGPVDDGVKVSWIADQVVLRVSKKAKINYGDGNKGWIGDVPKFCYSTKKIQSYGWSPRLGSEAAIIRAVDEIAKQFGV